MKKGIVFALAASLALLVPAGIASAGDRDVIRRGSCADRWRVRIGHGDQVAFRGRRTTGGASGSFDVRIVEDDHQGADRFRARARNLSTGEVCTGQATS